MATTKKRINVTLSEYAEKTIAAIAKERKVPQATVAAQLIEGAIELQEDWALAKLADERASHKNTKYISHDKVWAQFGL